MSNLNQTGFKNRGIDGFLSNVSPDKPDVRLSKLGSGSSFLWFFGFCRPPRLVWDRPCPRTPERKRAHYLYPECFLNEAETPSPELLKRFKSGFIRWSRLRQCLLFRIQYQTPYSRLCHILHLEPYWCTNNFFFLHWVAILIGSQLCLTSASQAGPASRSSFF